MVSVKRLLRPIYLNSGLNLKYHVACIADMPISSFSISFFILITSS